MILLIAISPQNSGDFNQILTAMAFVLINQNCQVFLVFTVINKLIKKRFLAKKRKTIKYYILGMYLLVGQKYSVPTLFILWREKFKKDLPQIRQLYS